MSKQSYLKQRKKSGNNKPHVCSEKNEEVNRVMSTREILGVGVMVAELRKLTNIYQSTHLQRVNFIVCISHLIKAVF